MAISAAVYHYVNRQFSFLVRVTDICSPSEFSEATITITVTAAAT
ncbi:MAG: hypothetical protein JWN70_219, partial [Planctomycetaceae bacterium]|nr:hypothetical protein [Planctomycetaceae bacterium]